MHDQSNYIKSLWSYEWIWFLTVLTAEEFHWKAYLQLKKTKAWKVDKIVPTIFTKE